MTQFDPPQSYLDQYQSEHEQAQRKTSGMAITALVLSILGIIPCCGAITAVIGTVLGLIGVGTIRSDSPVKGRGLAFAAIIIGIIFIVVQVAGGMWFWRTFGAPVVEGPAPALRAGFAGDTTGFRNAFHGAGATATDEEINAFVDELRDRYGEFVSVEMIGTGQSRPRDPVFPATYRLTFTNDVVDAEAEIIAADETTGQIVMKLGSVRIIDPQRGDLEFPPPSTAPPPPPAEDEEPAQP